jgi:uncharacterized protein YegP (UPF0339 family)
VAELNVYKRTDGKWARRRCADNGNIIATDGSQGYSRSSDARAMGAKSFAGPTPVPT